MTREQAESLRPADVLFPIGDDGLTFLSVLDVLPERQEVLVEGQDGEFLTLTLAEVMTRYELGERFDCAEDF